MEEDASSSEKGVNSRISELEAQLEASKKRQQELEKAVIAEWPYMEEDQVLHDIRQIPQSHLGSSRSFPVSLRHVEGKLLSARTQTMDKQGDKGAVVYAQLHLQLKSARVQLKKAQDSADHQSLRADRACRLLASTVQEGARRLAEMELCRDGLVTENQRLVRETVALERVVAGSVAERDRLAPALEHSIRMAKELDRLAQSTQEEMENALEEKNVTLAKLSTEEYDKELLQSEIAALQGENHILQEKLTKTQEACDEVEGIIKAKAQQEEKQYGPVPSSDQVSEKQVWRLVARLQRVLRERDAAQHELASSKKSKQVVEHDQHLLQEAEQARKERNEALREVDSLRVEMKATQQQLAVVFKEKADAQHQVEEFEKRFQTQRQLLMDTESALRGVGEENARLVTSAEQVRSVVEEVRTRAAEEVKETHAHAQTLSRKLARALELAEEQALLNEELERKSSDWVAQALGQASVLNERNKPLEEDLQQMTEQIQHLESQLETALQVNRDLRQDLRDVEATAKRAEAEAEAESEARRETHAARLAAERQVANMEEQLVALGASDTTPTSKRRSRRSSRASVDQRSNPPTPLGRTLTEDALMRENMELRAQLARSMVALPTNAKDRTALAVLNQELARAREQVIASQTAAEIADADRREKEQHLSAAMDAKEQSMQQSSRHAPESGRERRIKELEHQLEALREHANALQIELVTVQEENRRQDAERMSNERSLGAARSQLKKLRGETAKMREALKIAEADAETARTEMKESQRREKLLRLEQKAQKQASDVAHAALAQLRREHTRVSQQMGRAVSQLDGTRKEAERQHRAAELAEEQRARQERLLASLQFNLDEASARAASAEDDRNQMQKTAEEARQALEEAQKNQQTAEEQVEKFKKHIKQAKTRQEAYSTKSEQLMAAMEAECARQRSLAEELKENNGQLKNAVQEQTSKAAEHVSLGKNLDYSMQEHAMSVLRGEYARVYGELQKRDYQVKQQSVSEEDKVSTVAQSALSSAREEAEHLRVELETAQEKIRNLEAALERRDESAQRERMRFREEGEEARERLQQLESEQRTLVESLREARERTSASGMGGPVGGQANGPSEALMSIEMKAVRSQLGLLREENETLRGEVRRLRKRVSELLADLQGRGQGTNTSQLRAQEEQDLLEAKTPEVHIALPREQEPTSTMGDAWNAVRDRLAQQQRKRMGWQRQHEEQRQRLMQTEQRVQRVRESSERTFVATHNVSAPFEEGKEEKEEEQKIPTFAPTLSLHFSALDEMDRSMDQQSPIVVRQ